MIKGYNYILSTIIIFLLIALTGCGEKTNNGKNENQPAHTVRKTSVGFNGYAYIENMYRDKNKQFLVVDTVEWFDGAAAAAAKKSDDVKDDLPGGFYIRNVRKDSIKIILPANSSVIMQTLSHNSTGNYNFNEKITADKFFNLLGNHNYEFLKQNLYEFKVVNDSIVSIHEKYIP